jgi:putative transposase
LTVVDLCHAAGMARQNYYKMRTQRKRQVIAESLVLDLVRQERAIQPKLGARKLLHLIRSDLDSAGVSIGRDRFFALLSTHDFLIERKVNGCRTTDSWHGFRVYLNLLKDRDLTGPHQALVSDITYIRTDEGFVYLALVMDAYSRVIVGFDCSDSLEAEGALRALGKALGQLPDVRETIHHSDRGSQYCCKAYVGALKAAGVRISMTEENHCYENAQAERLNGILKQEYGLGDGFACKQDAYAAVRQAVYLYNHRRPHQSLAYAFPMAVHTAA